MSVCQGDVRNGSIEGIELKCPVLVEGRALRADSGGAGKYRGGLGIDMRVRNLVEGRWNFEQTRRTECPPWGLWGGSAGEHGGYLLRLPGENDFKHDGRRAHSGAGRQPRRSCAPAAAAAGAIRSSAIPELVRADVIEELVSRDAAREHYGVVLRDDFSIDEAATARVAFRSSPRKRGPSPIKRYWIPAGFTPDLIGGGNERKVATRGEQEMAKLKLTIACGDYEIVRALKEGPVEADGIELILLTDMGPRERHWRLARKHEFDVCEENVGAYFMARDQGACRSPRSRCSCIAASAMASSSSTRVPASTSRRT